MNQETSSREPQDQRRRPTTTQQQPDGESSLSKKKGARRGKGQVVPVEEIFRVETYRPQNSQFRTSYVKSQQKPRSAQLKEKFWQTGSRVYLKPNSPQLEKLLKGLIESIDWEFVVGVDVACDKPLVCPICLEPATVCPRITKCGHVLCWTCTLRLFSCEYFKKQSGSNYWRKCPLCADPITKEDLRPARFQQIQPVAGDKNRIWNFIHLIRARNCNSLCCPLAAKSDSWEYGFTPFDRIVICEDPLTFWRKEFISLFCQKRLCLEYKQAPELAETTIEACDLLNAQLDSYQPGLVAQLEIEVEQIVSSLKERRPFHAEYELLTEISTAVPEPWSLSEWRETVANAEQTTLANYEESRPENTLVTETVIQDIIHDESYYHFFQSWDGQLKFLNPIYLKLFLHNAGGDFNDLPMCIPEAKLLSCAPYILDQSLKSRFPFLGHLPKGIPIEFYDIVPVHLLSNETTFLYRNHIESILKNFKLEEKRRNLQDRKYEKHVRQSERKKAGLERSQSVSPHVPCSSSNLTELDTTAHFPTLASNTNPATPQLAQTARQQAQQSFRDRVRHGELGIEEYPELTMKPSTRPQEKQPRVSRKKGFQTPGNWRTGGPLIHRDPSRTTDLTKARTRMPVQAPAAGTRTISTRSDGDFITEFPSLSR